MPLSRTTTQMRPHNRRKGKMSDDELTSIIKSEIISATGYVGSEVTEQRRKALEYFYGEPFGNEMDNRSAVVSTDVQDTIMSAMPGLMEIFGGSEEAVSFMPVGTEDVGFSRQATDTCNHVWYQENDGWQITYDWMFDALLQKLGVIKIWWDQSDKESRHVLENVNSLKLAELMENKEIEIKEQTQKEVPPEYMQFAPDGILYDITVLRTHPQGRVAIKNVPPEQFLLARRAVDLDTVVFTCHKERKTISEWMDEGYTWNELKDIPSHDEQDYNEERTARFSNDEEWSEGTHLDPSLREIWMYECHLRVDYDGDGHGESRAVTVAGPGHTLMRNEEEDGHPFIGMTPIPIPHKVFGISYADRTMDIQFIKSALLRVQLDNLYFINNGRTAVNQNVYLDDLLVKRPNDVVRVKGTGDPRASISPIDTNTLGNNVFQGLEYMDTVREIRTGITRYNQGLDAESLNQTATGMNQILGQAAKRELLVARTFAETGFKKAHKRILKLLVDHQDEPKVFRLRNQVVEAKPWSWDAEMDVRINVGLGHGTHEEQNRQMNDVLSIQQQVIQLQGGAEGPLLNLENVYNAIKRKLEVSGLKATELYVTDPAQAKQPPKEEQPDPKMVEVQQKHEREMQAIQQKHEREMLDIQLEDNRKQMEIGARSSTEAKRVAGQLINEGKRVAGNLENQKDQIEGNLDNQERQVEGQLDIARFSAAGNLAVDREKARRETSD